MKAQTNHNPPIKNCETCVHRYGDYMEFSRCVLHGLYCDFARRYGHCSIERDWQQIPPEAPRKSLRRWLMALLWD